MKISTGTTATKEMTQLHDFITDEMGIFDNSSLHHDKYEGDVTDMMCAAVDSPFVFDSPLKTTQLFPHTQTPLRRMVLLHPKIKVYT